MNRVLAFLLALIAATITLSSACAAPSSPTFAFHLTPDQSGNQIRARFRDFRHDDWSSSFVPSQLIGLDLAAFRAPGLRPLRFSLIREAGRIDCAGNGGSGNGSGNCTLSPDPVFAKLLQSSGVMAPTAEQTFGLVALDVRRELVSALADARYPRPTIDDLMALTAVGVTGRYINQLAVEGYRPREIHNLVEFGALKISPDWIGSFTSAGFGDLSPNELVQLKALNVTSDFMVGYERLGYGKLPASRLVQLKALGITPEFVSAHVPQHAPLPAIDQLIAMKLSRPKR